MDCERFREAIFDPLTEEGERHVEICSDCSDWKRRISEQEDLLARSFTPEPPGDLWTQVEARIHASENIPTVRVVSWMAVASALLLAVVGVLFSQKPEEIQNKPSLKLNIVEVSPEETKSLSGFVPGYDEVDSRQALANAIVPFGGGRRR